MSRLMAAIAFLCLCIGLSVAAGNDHSDLFPAALPGWSASEVAVRDEQLEIENPLYTENMDVLGDKYFTLQRRVLSRRYSYQGRDAVVSVSIDNYDCLGQSITNALQTDPDFKAQAVGNFKLAKVNQYTAVEVFGDKAVREAVGIILGDCLVVSVEGSGLSRPSDKELHSYIERLDLDRIKQTVPGP